MSFETKLRVIHILNHLAIVPAIYYGEWWMFLAALGWWSVIGCVGISAGFHRYLSHKAYKTHPWFEKISLFLGSLAMGGSPLAWAGAHRMHHAYTDKELDPHSPIQKDWWKIYIHYWGRIQVDKRFIADLLKNKTVMWIHRHYFSIITFWALGLTLIDPLLLIFGFCIPAVYAFHAYGQVNAWCHMWGYRTYNTKDHSYNNFVANLITWGEGWHNNHHNKPTNWQFGERWWEFDPAATLIKLVKKSDKYSY